MKKELIWWFLAIFMCIMIYNFTASPASTGANTQNVIEEMTGFHQEFSRVINFIIRKLTHISVFGLLAISLYNAFRKNKFLLAWILTVFYAASDEYHQALVPNRTSSAYDVMLDAGGALLAILILRKIIKKIDKKK